MIRRLRRLIDRVQSRRKAKRLKRDLLAIRKRKQKREQLELPFDNS